MPASEVMSLYRQHKLHSGPGGPVVKKKKQAVAIQISMARKEGHDIPKVKGSFQQGGQVPETGNYKVHQGERIYEDTLPPGGSVRDRPRGLGDPPSPARYHLEGDVWHPELKHRGDVNWMAERDVKGSFQHGGLVPETGNYLVHQGEDIARRTSAAYEAARRADMCTPRPPWETFTSRGPDPNDPRYAIEGLRGNVAQRMHEQGVRGSFQEGGQVPQTGNYQAHAGEELVPPDIGPERPGGTAAGMPAPGMPPSMGGTSVTPEETPAAPEEKKDTGQRSHEMWRGMAANVNAPLQRAEGFKTGGTIPRTGIYRLHAGEHVIPANLAKHYREFKRGK